MDKFDDTVKIRETAESDEMLLRTFVMCVGDDYRRDFRSPSLFPEFSDKTKFIWEEIEKRMKGVRVLGFERGKCVREIEESIESQNRIIRQGADYTTSYHVGIRSGLNSARRIIESCLTCDVEDQGKDD